MKWQPSVGQTGITWCEFGAPASTVMPLAGFAHIASVGASSSARWVKGALATQHLTLTRSDLRSSRQTGMVLMTLRCHAGDLATLSTAFLTDNDKHHFLSSLYFPYGPLLYLLSARCLRLKGVCVLFITEVNVNSVT